MQISVCISNPQYKKPISARRITPIIGYLACILTIMCIAFSSPLLAQTYDIDIDEDDEGMGVKPIEYRESPLRRFEIIFTASIPFSALHSYLTVRTVEMIRQDKVAPSISKANWNTVGGLTLLFSGFIAFWDYMHTRGTDIQDLGADNETIPLSVSMPTSGIGYTHRVTSREPMLRLLSVRF